MKHGPFTAGQARDWIKERWPKHLLAYVRFVNAADILADGKRVGTLHFEFAQNLELGQGIRAVYWVEVFE